VAVRRRQLSEGGACSLYCIVHYDRCIDEEIVCVSSSQFDAITDAVHVRQSQSSECNCLDDICSRVPSCMTLIGMDVTDGAIKISSTFHVLGLR